MLIWKVYVWYRDLVVSLALAIAWCTTVVTFLIAYDYSALSQDFIICVTGLCISV